MKYDLGSGLLATLIAVTGGLSASSVASANEIYTSPRNSRNHQLPVECDQQWIAKAEVRGCLRRLARNGYDRSYCALRLFDSGTLIQMPYRNDLEAGETIPLLAHFIPDESSHLGCRLVYRYHPLY